jgi:hypothetical protein
MKLRVDFKVFEIVKIVCGLLDYVADLKLLKLESPGNKKACDVSLFANGKKGM